MFEIIADAYSIGAYYVEDDIFLENPVLLKKVTAKYYSTEERNRNEAEWNKLCSEIESLSNMEVTRIARLKEIKPKRNMFNRRVRSVTTNNLSKEGLIHRLTNSYDERAIVYLVGFLSDDNPDIVAKAAFGLGQLIDRAINSILLRGTIGR